MFQAVRRSANSMADILANHGVENPDVILDAHWQDVTPNCLRKECEQATIKDITRLSKGEESSHALE